MIFNGMNKTKKSSFTKVLDDKKKKTKKIDKSAEYLFGWQRTQADFENYKKQTEKRIKEIIQFGNAELILDLLPLYSHFKSALQHIPSDQREQAWCQGLGHIQKMWRDLLEKFNVQEIKTIGTEFDHNLHEAIEYEEDQDKKDHEIIREIQAGYKMNDKVIQPAKVVVNKLKDK
jgi:molecular chaperone GrpE